MNFDKTMPWLLVIIWLSATLYHLEKYYTNRIDKLENQMIEDKLYYQAHMDSLRSVIEDLQQYQYHYNQESDDKLINAMILVESSGNDYAHCIIEDAAGALQIRRTMVRDVNRILKRRNSEKRYEFVDRWDRQKSIEMFNIYCKHYSLNTPEEKARCWNGGPKGIYKPATLGYWYKVKNKLIELIEQEVV